MYNHFKIDCEVNHRRLELERGLAAATRLASAPRDRGTSRWRSILSRFERSQVKRAAGDPMAVAGITDGHCDLRRLFRRYSRLMAPAARFSRLTENGARKWNPSQP
jgi:hypothetical protein